MTTLHLSAPASGFLRTTDAAAFLGVKPRTLRNWRSLRIGPPSRRLSATLVVYAIEDLRAFAEQRGEG